MRCSGKIKRSHPRDWTISILLPDDSTSAITVAEVTFFAAQPPAERDQAGAHPAPRLARGQPGGKREILVALFNIHRRRSELRGQSARWMRTEVDRSRTSSSLVSSAGSSPACVAA